MRSMFQREVNNLGWETVREDMSIYSQAGVDGYVYSTCSACANGCGCYSPSVLPSIARDAHEPLIRIV